MLMALQQPHKIAEVQRDRSCPDVLSLPDSEHRDTLKLPQGTSALLSQVAAPGTAGHKMEFPESPPDIWFHFPDESLDARVRSLLGDTVPSPPPATCPLHR